MTFNWTLVGLSKYLKKLVSIPRIIPKYDRRCIVYIRDANHFLGQDAEKQAVESNTVVTNINTSQMHITSIVAVIGMRRLVNGARSLR